MTNYDQQVVTAQLLAALYPCPNSPSGQHRRYSAVSPCIYCKAPAGRREPSEAGEQGLTGVPGSHLLKVVDSPPSLASRRSPGVPE